MFGKKNSALSKFREVLVMSVLGVFSGIVVGLIFGWVIVSIAGAIGGGNVPPIEAGVFLGMGAGAVIGGIFGGVIGYQDK